MKNLQPPDRLIVAADFRPDSRPSDAVKYEIFRLLQKLQGLNVYVKVNSILRACGYNIIRDIKDLGFRVCADLKLSGIPSVLQSDAELLSYYQPDMLTVMCTTGNEAISCLKETLPDTELLGVPVLSSISNLECRALHGGSYEETVDRLAENAWESKLDGFICPPTTADILRGNTDSELTINTPCIRSSWANIPDDDLNANSAMTPKQAFKAGADRVVIGRQITLADDPKSVVIRILEEIASEFP
jgi:orotidine-5'-phosphate decarboxylase